jgi:DNA invertase Pin-like site-specific DNA recombinase
MVVLSPHHTDKGCNMTTYGYARVSTSDQHLEPQLAQLTAAGCTTIYQEKVSGKAGTTRPQLKALLEAAQSGDIVVVCKIDRIARSTRDLLNILGDMNDRGVAFKALNSPIDTSTPVGNMVLQMLGVIAEFERTLMLERQQAGIERAKAEGKYKGGTPTARRQSEQVLALIDMGFTKIKVARQLNMGVASVYRIAAAARKGGAGC